MILPGIIEKSSQNLVYTDLFSKLLTNRIVFISDGIDSILVSIVQAQLLYLASISTEPIKIYINSGGGEVYSGLGLYDTIQLVKNTCIVETICIGLAASMSAILLICGTKGHRFALPNSTIMLHQPSGGTEGTVADMIISIKEAERLKIIMFNIITEHIKEGSEVLPLLERDFWMNPVTAFELGIIDGIK